jgi:hypothetical protein
VKSQQCLPLAVSTIANIWLNRAVRYDSKSKRVKSPRIDITDI